MPRHKGDARLWQYVEPRFAAVSVRTAGGTDPIVQFHRPSGRGLVAVLADGDSARSDRVVAQSWFAGSLAGKGLTFPPNTAGMRFCSTSAGTTCEAGGGNGPLRCAITPDGVLRECDAGDAVIHGASCVLLVTTDGCLKQAKTLQEIETTTWKALLSAQDSTHWAALLADRMAAGASFAAVALGFPDFDAVRASFRRRFQALAGHR